MANDYRNTVYCLELTDIKKKKEKLENYIFENTQTKVIYNIIKTNDGLYKNEFMKIYNYKCSYCGNSINNLNKSQFEIDHYIYEKSFKSVEEAGRISNLVLACYDCNRSKSSLMISNEYEQKLNPDMNTIKDVFYRDQEYYIRITQQYREEEFVKQFYYKLKLNQQTRRIDYLLMNLYGMYGEYRGTLIGEKLLFILMEIKNKRNLMTLKAKEAIHV